MKIEPFHTTIAIGHILTLHDNSVVTSVQLDSVAGKFHVYGYLLIEPPHATPN